MPSGSENWGNPVNRPDFLDRKQAQKNSKNRLKPNPLTVSYTIKMVLIGPM